MFNKHYITIFILLPIVSQCSEKRYYQPYNEIQRQYDCPYQDTGKLWHNYAQRAHFQQQQQDLYYGHNTHDQQAGHQQYRHYQEQQRLYGEENYYGRNDQQHPYPCMLPILQTSQQQTPNTEPMITTNQSQQPNMPLALLSAVTSLQGTLSRMSNTKTEENFSLFSSMTPHIASAPMPNPAMKPIARRTERSICANISNTFASNHNLKTTSDYDDPATEPFSFFDTPRTSYPKNSPLILPDIQTSAPDSSRNSSTASPTAPQQMQEEAQGNHHALDNTSPAHEDGNDDSLSNLFTQPSSPRRSPQILDGNSADTAVDTTQSTHQNDSSTQEEFDTLDLAQQLKELTDKRFPLENELSMRIIRAKSCSTMPVPGENPNIPFFVSDKTQGFNPRRFLRLSDGWTKLIRNAEAIGDVFERYGYVVMVSFIPQSKIQRRSGEAIFEKTIVLHAAAYDTNRIPNSNFKITNREFHIYQKITESYHTVTEQELAPLESELDEIFELPSKDVTRLDRIQKLFANLAMQGAKK